jgi:hypothetical protein
MARLTAKARKKLPAKTFAGPGRSFPIPDKNHARAALIDLGRAKGLSASQKAKIKARAHNVLGKP